MLGEGVKAGTRVSGEALGQLAALLRRLAGMPEYEAYISHLRQHHPEHPVPSEREFYDEYIRCRYGDGPTRCC
jgi:uncharacterized short protein YbdD (DUF466 family)